MFYTTLCCAVVNRHNNTFTLEETNESGNKNKQNRFYYKVHYNDGIICSYFMYFCLYQHPIADPGSPHITLLNFVIIVIALLFPLSQSFITILVWMALGAIGLPVFIGGGSGIGYLTNIFGGYTFSFLVIAIVLPLIRGKKYNRILYTIAAIVGVVLIDIIGMLFWKVNAGLSWKVAFLSGFVAFIPLDLVKAVIAAQIIPAFRKVMQSAE